MTCQTNYSNSIKSLSRRPRRTKLLSVAVCWADFRRGMCMRNISLVAAIGTPLTKDESLHVDGLEAHLTDQWDNGMTGVLVGGTMGAMQLLKGATYEQLVDRSIELSRSRGEV